MMMMMMMMIMNYCIFLANTTFGLLNQPSSGVIFHFSICQKDFKTYYLTDYYPRLIHLQFLKCLQSSEAG